VSTPTTALPVPQVRAARNAVFAVFALNGVLFSSFVSRIPDVRSGLDLDNGALGLLLLAIAAGSVLALPSAGFFIQRHSAAAVVRTAVCLDAGGLLAASTGAVLGNVPLTAAGLFCYGIGTGVWDVAMNVEGAEVERHLGRSIMPRFHAAWSFGSITGAAVGVPMAALHAPIPLHFAAVGVVSVLVVFRFTRSFLPVVEPTSAETAPASAGSAWLEPRTLAIGVMVLGFAVVEGSANDWLSLALIDGYDVDHWVGVAGFAVFVSAMTIGRLLGPNVLDRWGRVRVLWATAFCAALGIVLTVFGTVAPVVVLGILVWGFGASLGFPVGMSAAADDPRHSAGRVAVVSTIGYTAFLAGPPLLGYLGDHVGTLEALLAVAVLMAPAAVSVTAARPQQPARVP